MKIMNFILFITIITFAYSCGSSNSGAKNEGGDANKKLIGVYTHHETGGGEDRAWDYSVEISEKNGELKALYIVDGYQTMTRINCKVALNDNVLDLLFESYGEDDLMKGDSKAGDKLFTFTVVDEKSIKSSEGQVWNKK